MNYCEFLLLSIYIVQQISPYECKVLYRPLSNAATQPFTIVKTPSGVATEPFTQVTTTEGKQTVFKRLAGLSIVVANANTYFKV